MYAPTVAYLRDDVKKWCLEEIHTLLVWSVCGTIYMLNTENVIKTSFITTGNMHLNGGEKGGQDAHLSSHLHLLLYGSLNSFVSANSQFSKPLVFSETLE